MEYKLVPVEPSEEMEAAFTAETLANGATFHDCYAAMLHAATDCMQWVKVSERLPTREDADDRAMVWAWPVWGKVSADFYDNLFHGNRPGMTHWMPKPRQQPPEPPALQQEGKA